MEEEGDCGGRVKLKEEVVGLILEKGVGLWDVRIE